MLCLHPHFFEVVIFSFDIACVDDSVEIYIVDVVVGREVVVAVVVVVFTFKHKST